MREVEREMQEFGDMVVLPVSPLELSERLF
jgi:hypothetical protein